MLDFYAHISLEFTNASMPAPENIVLHVRYLLSPLCKYFAINLQVRKFGYHPDPDTDETLNSFVPTVEVILTRRVQRVDTLHHLHGLFHSFALLYAKSINARMNYQFERNFL